MTRQLVSTGSPMEQKAGYSRAVIQDNIAHVAGTTGYDYQTMQMPADVRRQTQNCLKTVSATLEQGGFTAVQIVRVRYYVTDRANVAAVFEEVGAFFRDIGPAATMILCDPVDPSMLIEIEATAQK